MGDYRRFLGKYQVAVLESAIKVTRQLNSFTQKSHRIYFTSSQRLQWDHMRNRVRLLVSRQRLTRHLLLSSLLSSLSFLVRVFWIILVAFFTFRHTLLFFHYSHLSFIRISFLPCLPFLTGHASTTPSGGQDTISTSDEFPSQG